MTELIRGLNPLENQSVIYAISDFLYPILPKSPDRQLIILN